jgi:Flp pilus assembly protein TadG
MRFVICRSLMIAATEEKNVMTSSTHRRRGTSVVEFALVVPIILTIFIGILESAWLSRTHLIVANATREGARSGALGRTTAVMTTRIQNTALPLTITAGEITMQWSSDNGTTWTTLGTNGSFNNAASGNLVRVTVAETHRALTGFFPFLNNRIVRVRVAMRREATG